MASAIPASSQLWLVASLALCLFERNDMRAHTHGRSSYPPFKQYNINLLVIRVIIRSLNWCASVVFVHSIRSMRRRQMPRSRRCVNRWKTVFVAHCAFVEEKLPQKRWRPESKLSTPNHKHGFPRLTFLRHRKEFSAQLFETCLTIEKYLRINYSHLCVQSPNRFTLCTLRSLLSSLSPPSVKQLFFLSKRKCRPVQKSATFTFVCLLTCCLCALPVYSGGSPAQLLVLNSSSKQETDDFLIYQVCHCFSVFFLLSSSFLPPFFLFSLLMSVPSEQLKIFLKAWREAVRQLACRVLQAWTRRAHRFRSSWWNQFGSAH